MPRVVNTERQKVAGWVPGAGGWRRGAVQGEESSVMDGGAVLNATDPDTKKWLR